VAEANPAPIEALFVSPHFDDVALSCGGSVAQAAQLGATVVVTVFAGQPAAPLNEFARLQHQRWGVEEAVEARQREDRAAMAILGAQYRWLAFPDAIYRGDQYLSDLELFGPVKATDRSTELAVSAAIAAIVAELRPRVVYGPLAAGGHVDHRICRSAVLALATQPSAIRLYEDMPYALSPRAIDSQLADLAGTCGQSQSNLPGDPAESIQDRRPTARAWVSRTCDVTSTFGARIAAIRAYGSQLPTIFRDVADWEGALQGHAARVSSQPGYLAERFWGRT
jgi:LmbE family N-acetylglucosaminyl deacetylase